MSSDPIRRLQTLGHDISNLPLSKIPLNLNKCCFICINSFESFRRNLGTGPINDALTFAKCAKTFDYDIYILQSPHKRNFMLYFERFLNSVENHLIFFYVGQMNQNFAKTLGETSFVFDDGTIPESNFIDKINEIKKENCKLTLITDSCPSGSIFDIKNGQVFGKQLPPLVLSLSTIPDPKQFKKINQNNIDDQGIFIYQLTHKINSMPELTLNQISESLKKLMKEFGVLINIGTTTESLLNEPFFIQ